MKEYVICITGGHVTPAIAVIEEVKRRGLPWKIMFIGRNHAFEDGGSQAHEERLVKALGVRFYAITTGRLERHWSPFTVLSLLKVPFGFVNAWFLLLRYRPKAVLTFGGYIALPVALAARMLGIAIITHEQTLDLGLANRIIAQLARRVILARDSGVPIRRLLFYPPAKPSFICDSKRPILYVTGGSSGAMSLNALVFPNAAILAKTYTVIHQVGSVDLRNALMVKKMMPPSAQTRYVIADYFDVADVAWIYAHAALIVGRSGANTVAEVSALGVPALFIPLPWAADDEQSKNARWAAKQGMAVVLGQHTLSVDILRLRVNEMMRSIHRFRSFAKRVAEYYPRDGASGVVDALIPYCP